jgi:UTP:GlnB (protein PII) uridylyltransferase
VRLHYLAERREDRLVFDLQRRSRRSSALDTPARARASS